jgi:hypothetical protein
MKRNYIVAMIRVLRMAEFRTDALGHEPSTDVVEPPRRQAPPARVERPAPTPNIAK